VKWSEIFFRVGPKFFGVQSFWSLCWFETFLKLVASKKFGPPKNFYCLSLFKQIWSLLKPTFMNDSEKQRLKAKQVLYKYDTFDTSNAIQNLLNFIKNNPSQNKPESLDNVLGPETFMTGNEDFPSNGKDPLLAKAQLSPDLSEDMVMSILMSPYAMVDGETLDKIKLDKQIGVYSLECEVQMARNEFLLVVRRLLAEKFGLSDVLDLRQKQESAKEVDKQEEKEPTDTIEYTFNKTVHCIQELEDALGDLNKLADEKEV
jgi:hypothetical protein